MSLEEALLQQECAWNQRTVVRRQYGEWYGRIVEELSSLPGKTVELGSGIGRFKDYKPDAIMTDVEPTRWSDAVVDAQQLPYGDGELANLVLLDVFHHLADPARFLDECRRVLAPRGRAVIVDPYCSPLSTVIYRRFHHERTELDVPSFERDERTEVAPLESNQARTTLVFYRDRARYLARWPELPIVAERRFAFLLYPLSGGFTKRPLLPALLYGPVRRLERALQPFAPLLAFRCLVVLERE